MRTTQDALLKIARDTAEKAFVPNPNVTAAFLVGSMLSENPFMGNSTDIDLLVIYKGVPPHEREVLKLTNEIALISLDGESGGIYWGNVEISQERPSKELACVAEWKRRLDMK